MEEYDKSDVFLCSECNIGFSYDITLKKHIDRSHKGLENLERKIKCKVCLKMFSTYFSLKFHRAQVHADYTSKVLDMRGVLNNCDICGITVRYLDDHMENIHINPDKNKKICPTCNFVGRPGDLTRHIESKHTKDNIKSCPFCAEVFKSVRGHLERTNCGRKPEDFLEKVACAQCNKLLANKDILHKHVKFMHNKVKDNQCDQCDYKSNRAGNLRLHIRKRHSIKPVEKQACPHCNKNVGNLLYHIEIYHTVI